MKKLLFVGLAILLLMPVVASAQNAFDGTWKIDLKQSRISQEARRLPAAEWHVSMQNLCPTHRH